MTIEISHQIESIVLNPALSDEQIAVQIQGILQNYTREQAHQIVQRSFHGSRGDNDSAMLIAIKKSLPRTASLLLHYGGGVSQFLDAFNQSFLQVYNLVSKCQLAEMPLYNPPNFTETNMTWIEAFRTAAPSQRSGIVNFNSYPREYYQLEDAFTAIAQLNRILISWNTDEEKAAEIKNILKPFRYGRHTYFEVYGITQGFGSVDSPFRTAIRLNLPLSLKALSHSSLSFDLRQFSSRLYWPNNNLLDLLALVNEYPAIGNTSYTHTPLGNGYPDYGHTFREALQFCVNEQASYGFTGVYEPLITYVVPAPIPAPVAPAPMLNQFPQVIGAAAAAAPVLMPANTSPITRFIDANNLRDKIVYKTYYTPHLNIMPPEIKLPEECYCPIGQGLMEDPVTNEVGQVYERREITAFYNQEAAAGRPIRDVVTRDLITNLALFPCLPIRNLILDGLKAGLERLNTPAEAATARSAPN